jgi:para-aminobenzoate synthetase / 4-amino-4-deoxychorismate lyase
MLQGGKPFVLLDDARPGGRRLLYRAPHDTIVAETRDALLPALDRLQAAVDGGRHVAGWIAYEAGHALEPRLRPLTKGGAGPLLWFGLFDPPEPFDPATLPDPAGAWAGPPRPNISRAEYDAALAQVLGFIAAGDIYQANYSFRAAVRIMGDPLALYARLRASGGGGWGGIVHDGHDWLLSVSPELFFTSDPERITTRPMKGTRPRGHDAAEDEALAAALASDPKDRAENLMIVDLLRNDLSRVAQPGSVTVPSLFTVEHYPTVHQMVSEVTAAPAPHVRATDVIRALFPCGSVTGAPKLRAMEIIDALEADPRGAYTGAIGFASPDGNAAFNVAIRTLTIEEGAHEARIGLGSAIVADSDAASEWAECLAKGAFVTAGARPFDLIETMLFDPGEGIVNLDAHVRRIEESARAFGFVFDRHQLRNEIHIATFRYAEPARVRLRLSASGATATEVGPLPESPTEPVTVRAVPLPVAPDDFRLRHKTSDRAFYDTARRKAGTFEVVFVRPDGLVTEGSFTNIFVRRGDTLVTPPLALGVMPGVSRAKLIEAGEAEEGMLTVADLRDGFCIGNAVRGMITARLG